MNENTRIFCNNCRNYTHHKLLYSHIIDEDEYFDLNLPEDIDQENLDREVHLWACCGCDRVTMQEIKMAIDAEEVDSEYYPSREKYHHTRKSFLTLNPKLSQIYEEIILCYNNDSPILCATGLRALLEGVCADKGISGRSLFDKINNLDSHLPKNIVESLHHFRFIGNEAVHQLTAPSIDDLRSAIEVMEDLLNFLYDLDYKASNLSRKAGVETGSGQQIRPKPEVIKRVLERRPYLSPGPKTLFRVLYRAGSKGLKFEDIASGMERTPVQLGGVLGALGRRINNTSGVEGKPGVAYILEIVREIDGDPEAWGWRMRFELQQIIRDSVYTWAEDWK